jgi:hypothetical protein
MVRYVTIRKFSDLSGYSEDAIRAKIKNGIWLQDAVWKKAPDGRILMDVKGYEAWVEGNSALYAAGAHAPRHFSV